jgi:hypothetical protein
VNVHAMDANGMPYKPRESRFVRTRIKVLSRLLLEGLP